MKDRADVTRAPVSVVIPTLNAAADLAQCAGSLLEGVHAGLIRDLVISDGGSTDATRDVARELGAQVITGAPGRGGQIARGVAASDGPWLLLLHADTELRPGWAEVVAEFVAESREAAGYFHMDFRARGVLPAWVAGWARFRARAFGLPYGDQGLVVSRQLLNHVGGVPDMPLMEDVALARALRGRLVALGARLTTSAERYERDGWLRRGGRNLWTLTRYLAGKDPAELAKSYRAGTK